MVSEETHSLLTSLIRRFCRYQVFKDTRPNEQLEKDTAINCGVSQLKRYTVAPQTTVRNM